jgi:hypothetical protein
MRWFLAMLLLAWVAPIQAQENQAKKRSRLTEAEFKQLKPILDVKNQPWTTIPWNYSITEARRLAAKTKKPIFLNVNTGNCLGHV